MNRATSATGWVRNPDGTLGYTWNPITGCLNHDKGLCKEGNFPCYAYRLANGRLRERYLANTHLAPHIPEDTRVLPTDPFYPRFWEDRLNELDISKLKYSQFRDKGIFVCDMSDLFGVGIPEEWIQRIMNIIKMNWHHRFYLLTKQPQNLIKFSPFPEHCYVGVTLTTKKQHFALFYSGFKNIEANIKYASLEPLLENLYFHPEDIKVLGINQVIIGACTGKPKELMELQIKYPDLEPVRYGNKLTLQPKIEWVQEIVEAADKAGIPVFLKDNLMPLFSGGSFDSKGKLTLIPMGKLRQELPK